MKARTLANRGQLLVRLAKSLDFRDGGLESALRNITESASEAMGVDRVGIWTYEADRGQIICTDQWDQSTGEHTMGATLSSKEYPTYFQALEQELTIPASHAHTDPSTAAFSETYLTPLGIESMLDIPLRLRGRMIGVICFESRARRDWSTDEEMFAACTGDLVTHAIEVENHRRLESELLQAQRLEAIGMLAGGIAHDLNNIMTPIWCHAEALLESDPDDAVAVSAQQILTAARRGADLIKRVLRSTTSQGGERSAIDLPAVVDESLQLVRAAVSQNVEVVFSSGPCPPLVADPGEIQRVMLNLCANAAQAIGTNPGRVEIHVEEATVPIALATSDLAEGSQAVRLSVTDTGPGIEKENLQRIFEPFFSTKGPDEGTGLGLATVREVVSSHGGTIRVDSDQESGTLIEVYFPVRTRSADEVAGPPLECTDDPEARVLFVEDEVAIRTIVGEYLERKGHSVTMAEGPAEAVRLLEKSTKPGAGAPYEVIVTDYSMPGGTGLELLEKVREMGIKIPVILLTGHAALTREEARERGFRDLVSKPVSLHHLDHLIRQERTHHLSPSRG